MIILLLSIDEHSPINLNFRNWFQPLGTYFGIKYSVHKRPVTNEMLEAEYNKIRSDKNYDPSLESLSQQLDMSQRQIQVWIRKRKLFGKLIVCQIQYVLQFVHVKVNLQSLISFVRLVGDASITQESHSMGFGASGTNLGCGTLETAGMDKALPI